MVGLVFILWLEMLFYSQMSVDVEIIKYRLSISMHFRVALAYFSSYFIHGKPCVTCGSGTWLSAMQFE